MNTKRNPQTKRFAREVTEKDLTIRFLAMKLEHIQGCLRHMIDVKSQSQRLGEIHKLYGEVSIVVRELDKPRRNMSFYSRREGVK